MLVDGSVSAAQMGAGPTAPFLKHLLWVDGIKNVLITYWCSVAQGFPAKAQKPVLFGFVRSGSRCCRCSGFVNPVAGSTALPPPVLGYLGVTWTAYFARLVREVSIRSVAASKNTLESAGRCRQGDRQSADASTTIFTT